MRKLAIIPARGGSKRIPKKNIKSFLGKPIIAYSIEAALKSGLFDTVMVSTDNSEIAEVAKEYGAEVPFLRSAENADDFATTADVILEVVQEYEANGEIFEFACCIYPTAPLLSVETLKDGWDLLREKHYATVFPVAPFGYPIRRSLRLEDDNRAVMNWPEHINTRSQDLEQAYHDAGQFYWLSLGKFTKQQKLFTDNTGVIVLDEMQVQDIDNEVDWKIAELKMQLR